MKKEIAFIVTYFGTLPFYFPAFQLSCRYNPHIQWFIFTDCDEPPDLPENITFVKFSIDEFMQLATRKLGYEIIISPEYLYKICDFKPAFGVIYEDYVKEYSFWGHCDIDIVWGQIDSFIDETILQEYDIITSRPGRVSGHFCLYRNIDKINSLFLAMPVTELRLQRVDSCERLDEIHFTGYLQKLIRPGIFTRIKQFNCEKPFVPKVYWSEVLTTSGKHQRKLYEREDNCFRWKQGKVYHVDGSELMYLHFHKLKASLKEINFSYQDDPNEVFISSKGLFVR